MHWENFAIVYRAADCFLACLFFAFFAVDDGGMEGSLNETNERREEGTKRFFVTDQLYVWYHYHYQATLPYLFPPSLPLFIHSLPLSLLLPVIYCHRFNLKNGWIP